MKSILTLAAAACMTVMIGCESTDSTSSMGAVSDDCCGSCSSSCGGDAAPGAVSDCGSSCGAAQTCPATGANMGALGEKKAECGTSCCPSQK